MITAWSHLPNAHHIDRILADLTVNPGDWHWAWHRVSNRAGSAAWAAARSAARSAAWDRARDAARNRADLAALDAALDAVYSATNLVAWAATESAILALIAWPESAEYLDLPVEQVRVLVALGDHKAALMLPAVIVVANKRK